MLGDDVDVVTKVHGVQHVRSRCLCLGYDTTCRVLSDLKLARVSTETIGQAHTSTLDAKALHIQIIYYPFAVNAGG